MMALPPGHRLLHLPSCESTNAVASEQARAGAAGGLVVLCDRQTAGRGRQGRAWLSSAGNLTFSLLRRPGVPPQQAPRWTLLAGLAVIEGLAPVAPGLWLKWPNDVQIGQRKVGGILCELEGGAIVVGIGLNLTSPEGGWPEDLQDRAGELPAGVGSRDQVLCAVVAAFDRLERELLAVGPPATMSRYRRALAPMLGRRVTVDAGRERYEAEVLSVDDSGALVVVDGSGARRTILAGDVHLLPPGGT